MPMVLAFTAKPMAAGETLYARASIGRIACVANKSTSVRNAVRQMTIERSSTAEEWPCISIDEESMTGAACVMIGPSARRQGECDAPFATRVSGRHRLARQCRRLAPSHVVVGLVVQDITDEQHDGLAAEVLPPVRCAAGLRPDVAGLVHDRLGTVAGVFDDFAFRDVDDGGAVAVAVPGHDAARLDREL